MTENVSIIIRAKDLASRVFSGVAGGLKRVRVSAAGLRTAFLAVIASVGGLVFAFKKLFDAGASVLETQSKFNTVFGTSAERMDEFNNEFARTAGLTKTVGQGLLATTGQIVQGLGFSTDASAEFSKAVLLLAGDLASFNDIPTAETARAIQAALTGERESLKRLGVVILETDVQKRALLLTGKENAKQLTQQEKATATLTLITERAGVAVGDLNRTQDSAANRAKQVKAAFADQFNQLSTDLIPVLQQLLPLFQQLADKAEAATTRVASFITTLFDLAGITSSTIREELRAFNALPTGQRAGRLSDLRTEIAGKRTRIDELGSVTGLGPGAIQKQLKEREELRKETDDLQIALDIMETTMARLKDTSAGTADAVENVIAALKGGAPGAPGAPDAGLGAPGLAAFGSGAFGTAGRRGSRANAITGRNQFLGRVLREQQEKLAESAAEAAAEVDRLGTSVVTNFSQMTAAAISGSQRMEQVVISAFTNILASLPGVGGLFGSVIGLAGGLLGSLFGGGRRDPVLVDINRFRPEALDQQRSIRTEPEIQITIIDPRRNVREILAELNDLEARDGVARVPVILGGRG